MGSGRIECDVVEEATGTVVLVLGTAIALAPALAVVRVDSGASLTLAVSSLELTFLPDPSDTVLAIPMTVSVMVTATAAPVTVQVAAAGFRKMHASSIPISTTIFKCFLSDWYRDAAQIGFTTGKDGRVDGHTLTSEFQLLWIVWGSSGHYCSIPYRHDIFAA